MDSFNEEGYYIQACIWITLNDYDRAYKILKQLVIAIESPQRDTYRLFLLLVSYSHIVHYKNFFQFFILCYLDYVHVLQLR